MRNYALFYRLLLIRKIFLSLSLGYIKFSVEIIKMPTDNANAVKNARNIRLLFECKAGALETLSKIFVDSRRAIQ